MQLKHIFYAQSIINILLKKGIRATEVYKIIGISLKAEDPLEHEISIKNIHDLTVYYKNKLDIEHCGLSVANYLSIHNSGFFGSYALSCETLKDSFLRIYAVHKEINSLFNYDMIPPEHPSKFVYHLDRLWEAKYPETAKEIVEFVIASGLGFTRKLTRQSVNPISIGFKHSKPANTKLYEDFFKCPVNFGQEHNIAVYPSDTLDLQIPTYNPALLEILGDYAKKTIEEQAVKKNIVTSVKALIIKSAHSIIPLEEDIAFQLNISKRSLQQKLQECGTTFKRILESVLKELAVSYMESNRASNKEIAWLLGYNDISNFHRAFKRWTGKTPNEYREMVLS
jgi:AraC-like DNA-binding protein